MRLVRIRICGIHPTRVFGRHALVRMRLGEIYRRGENRNPGETKPVNPDSGKGARTTRRGICAARISENPRHLGYGQPAGGQREGDRADRRADARQRNVARDVPERLESDDATDRAADCRERKSERTGGETPPNGTGAPKRNRRESQSENETQRQADRRRQNMVRLQALAPQCAEARK